MTLRAPFRRLARLAVPAALLALPAAARAAEPVLSLRAFAVNMSGVGAGRAGTLDIVVERWSTEEERNKLRAVLVERGGEALIDTLRDDVKDRTGYIRTSRSLGWDLKFARELPLPDGGRRIILATDRPMSFAELRNQPRSSEYEFLLIEIRLDKDGKGQGKLAGGAKVEFDKESNTVEIENYGIEPVRLTEVKVVGPKPKK
jgi:hypothetical protein